MCGILVCADILFRVSIYIIVQNTRLRSITGIVFNTYIIVVVENKIFFNISLKILRVINYLLFVETF